MNKNKKEMLKEDAAFLRAHVAATEERTELPWKLNEQNTVTLVSGTKQRPPVGKIVRRSVAGVLAACLVVLCFAAYDFGVYKPAKLTVKDGQPAYAESYDTLVGIIGDYAKYRYADRLIPRGGFNLYAKSTDAAEAMDVKEEVVYEAEADFKYSYSDAASADSMAPAEGSTWAAVENAEPKTETASVTSSSQKSHSELNERVKGVAEADIVRTDGEYIYVLTYGDTLGIYKAGENGEIIPAASFRPEKDLSGEYAYIHDFYVFGNTLVINVETYDNVSSNAKTGALIYDVTDRADPVFLRYVLQDGSYLSSRVVNGSLITVSTYYLYYGSYEKRTVENSVPGVYETGCEEKLYVPAEDIAVLNTEKPDSYIVIGKYDFNDPSAAPETAALFGGGSEIYCTDSDLFVFSEDYCVAPARPLTLFGGAMTFAAPETTVLRFDITGEKPVFKSMGTFDGYILNSFSSDWYGGYLRIAATRNSDNAVYVLDGDMNTVSVLEGIGEGEIIKSVRFSGNTAYVVTFVQTDPLFVIDLTDPLYPEKKGEVKLPGFSSYLHPAGDGYLIGIGVDGTETGINNNAKISLFDVSDPASPKEADSLVLPDCMLQTDYKAFVTVKEDGSFIIPANSYQWYTEEEENGFSTSAVEGSGAVRVKAENGKLVFMNGYFSDMGYESCERAVYIGDTLYTVCRKPCIVSYRLSDGEELSRHEEEYENYGDTYWGVDGGTVEAYTEGYSEATTFPAFPLPE